MDGILIIDKPGGWTSHDVVAGVRPIFRSKRVGHTGTLDPFATGVLVVLLGKATRLAQFLDKDEKEYEAVIQFGYETDTGDRTGVRTAECGLQSEEIAERLAEIDWPETLAQFAGEIEQVPPMYSAKKVHGKKLYELARQGVAVARQPVKVVIRELEVMSQERVGEQRSMIRIRAVCSAGTYVRTLAQDIGRVVGLGAHCAELRRTRAGRFNLSESVRIEELQGSDDPTRFIRSVVDAIGHLPEFVLPDERVERTRNGLSTCVQDMALQTGAPIRMTDPTGELIAIGYYDAEGRAIQPKIVLV